MKVLYLSYDGLTDPLGQSQILPYLAGLSDKGHQILILSFEKRNAYRENAGLIQELSGHYSLKWFHLAFPENKSKLSQLSSFLAFRRRALTLAVENQVDITHCRSYPAAMAGRYIQKKKGVPWIFDIRGFWIDERKEGKIWNLHNPFICMAHYGLRRIENKLYRKASAIVSLTHEGERLIRERFLPFSWTNNISVIPCCADYHVFKPSAIDLRKEVRFTLGIPPSGFILTYLGSIGTWYLLGEMLEFFKLLLSQKPEACFLFITGENPVLLEQAALSHQIPVEKIRVKKASREQVPLLLSASDCGISFIKPVFSKKASSPVKWAEMLACGLPLITNAQVGDIESLSKQLQGVVVVDDFSVASFQAVIDHLPFIQQINAEEIRELSRSFYDLDRGIESYNSVYQKIKNKKILFIATHRPGRAPNQRFRFEQYFSYFEKEGFNYELSYLMDKTDDDYMYKPGHLVKKAWFLFGKSTIRRLKSLTSLKNYALIFVAREALMTHSVFFERRYSHSKSGLIFDFDDSIWLSNVSSANRFFHWMKNPSKTPRLISMASQVVAGNQYLADYAHQWNDKVIVIPTALDTEIYKPVRAGKSNSGVLTIGWTGSITTIPHFEYIVPVLIKIKDKYQEKVRFEVVGDPDYYHAGLNIIGRAWSPEEEKEVLSTFDIGIMPLPDDEWTRGKCGFKGLLCMSMGIPVIMSPVGVNKDIIEDGINGYLAGDMDQWFQKLCSLIDSEDLRRAFALTGRKTVETKYSVDVWKGKYIEIFKKLS
jgi:glycosyltransferase involved in cell wall biosynthesis